MAGRYIMTDEELRKVQLVEIEMLEEVDRICKKCNIKYNMVGGTMLGAIRHGGYIPWDDDADLGMLRGEYERFREAIKTELNHDRFYFQEMRDTEGYRWGYAKLRRKGTEFIRNQQEFMPYEQGIFIDIFPFDNVPDCKIIRPIHMFSCFVLRKFLWSEVGARSEKNKIKKIAYKLMRLVPRKQLVKWYNRKASKSSKKRTQMVRIMTFPAPKGKYGFYRKWYEDTASYKFDRIELMGAREYDDYLTHKFGNYMQLPPESERKVHPISKLTV